MIMPDEISISEDDLLSADRANEAPATEEVISVSLKDLEQTELLASLHEPAKGKLIHLGSTKSIVVGYPVDQNHPGEIWPPDRPHVFTVDDLYVSDGKYVQKELDAHPNKKVPENQNMINLGKTTIIIGHGIKKEGVWQYQNGQSIPETLIAYNDKAKTLGLPQAQMIVSCNVMAEHFDFRTQNVVENGLDIRIGEFGLADQNQTVAYAVDELVKALGIVKNGGVSFYVYTAKPMFGLDNLIMYKNLFPQG